jgi:hypothetical protein
MGGYSGLSESGDRSAFPRILSASSKQSLTLLRSGTFVGSTRFSELETACSFSWLSVIRSLSTLLSATFLALLAMVGFNVRDPCIFRRVLFYMGEVEQQIETGKIRISLNDGLRLLVL